jgi:uncharacterized protein with PIN domain
MSITLFYCAGCGIYAQHNTAVDITVKAKIDIQHGAFWLLTMATPLSYIMFHDIVYSHCPECNGPMDLVTLEQCPQHMWRKHQRDKSRRVCVLCGKEQEGHVVFDK